MRRIWPSNLVPQNRGQILRFPRKELLFSNNLGTSLR
jgi:hypothetical protein